MTDSEGVCAYRLADRDHERTAEGLPEDHGGGADGDIFDGQDGLGGHQGLLHAKTNADTEESLVTNPLRVASVHLEGRKEASANSHDDRGDVHQRRVISYNRDGCTGYNADDNES